MEKLSTALAELKLPVTCMGNVKEIPNASLHLMRELAALPNSSDPDRAAKYVLRDTPLNLMSLGPFCTYPQGIQEHYKTLVEFAKTGSIDPLARILNRFSQVTRPWKGCDGKQSASGETYQPLLSWMIHFLSDGATESRAENRKGVFRLIPGLIELTDREIWNDLLLVSTLPTPSDQDRLKKAVQYILTPRSEFSAFNDTSIFDVGMKVISESNLSEIYHLAEGIRKLIRKSDPVLEPGLLALRRATYTNDVHPFLGLIRESLSRATQEKEFYRALFRVSIQPEFSDSIQLLSTMSKDGRLKELIEDTMKLFRKFAEEARDQVQIHDGVLPELLSLRHHLTAQDLGPSPHAPITDQTSWYNHQCENLDLNFSLDQVDSDQFDKQLDFLLHCQNGQGSANNVSQALDFLRSSTLQNGQSFLKYQIQSTRDLFTGFGRSEYQLNSQEVNFLLDGWMSAMDDGRLFRLLDAIPFWVQPNNDTGTDLAKPLLQVTRAIVSGADRDLKELENYASKILVKDEFPKLLADVDDLLSPDLSVQEVEQEVPLPSALAAFSRQQIADWVDAKECAYLSAEPGIRRQQIGARVEEILREAQYNVTNWDLVGGNNLNEGVPRQSWEMQELRDLIGPILDKVADRDRQSVPQKWILESFLNFLRYFAMPPDESYPGTYEQAHYHYQPDFLLEWLHERSVDYRPITYFYPGAKYPRVRLVNSLDLLELTVANVDFDAPPPLFKNMGLDFLDELADAWGDEPPELWPSEIRKKYSPKKMPRTLLSAVEDIVNRPGFPGLDNLEKLSTEYVGLPVLPGCLKKVDGEVEVPQGRPSQDWIWKIMPSFVVSQAEREKIQRHLYNLWQVKSVLKENALKKYGKYEKNGMSVLRNLFYEVKYSTPERFRKATSKDKNNLSVILKTVKLGLLGQVGKQLQKFDKNDPVLKDFFRAVIHMANSPFSYPTLGVVMTSDPEHKLTWKLIEAVNKVLDEGTPVDVANMKQLVFYSLAASNRLEEWVPTHSRSGSDLVDRVLWRMHGVMQGYTEFLSRPEVDFIGDLLTSQTLASFSKSLYINSDESRRSRLRNEVVEFFKDNSGYGENRVNNLMNIMKSVYENEDSRLALGELKNRLDSVIHSDAYKKLDLTQAIRPVLRFFEERAGTDEVEIRPQDKELAKKLRHNLSHFIQEGSLDEILYLESGNQESFYQLLQTLSRLSVDHDDTGLKNFFRMMRRSLSEKPY
jgi:hypothetical protein